MKYSQKAFTLIELLVSISILSIIMVSVFTIFFLSSDINNKTDISRSMQENVKHIVETLAEDLRKNTILWVTWDWEACKADFWSEQYVLSGSKICIGKDYYLAQKIEDNYIRQIDISACREAKNSCVLMQWANPLSNSWVEFEDLKFQLLPWSPARVIVTFTLRPSLKKWVKPELIKDNTLIFQTTLSKRMY